MNHCTAYVAVICIFSPRYCYKIVLISVRCLQVYTTYNHPHISILHRWLRDANLLTNKNSRIYFIFLIISVDPLKNRLYLESTLNSNQHHFQSTHNLFKGKQTTQNYLCTLWVCFYMQTFASIRNRRDGYFRNRQKYGVYFHEEFQFKGETEFFRNEQTSIFVKWIIYTSGKAPN